MIRTLDKDFLSPLLLQHSFKKKDLTWNRSRNGITQVVNVQLGKFSGPDRIDLTVNLGIWMPDVWSVYWNKQHPDFIEEDDCFPRFRIGDVLANFGHDSQDAWWSVQSMEDTKKVVQELGAILSTNVVPFLSRFATMLEVKSFCDSANLRLLPADKLYYAILNYLVGDRAGYERLIADFSDESLRAWRPRMAEVTQRLEAIAQSIP